MEAGEGGINERKKLDIRLLADAKIRPGMHLPGDRSAHLRWPLPVCIHAIALSLFGALFFLDPC